MKYPLCIGAAAALVGVGLIVLLAGGALAETITTKSGLVIRNAKVAVIEGDGIRVTYPGGAAKVLFSEMTPNLAGKYGSPAVKEVVVADHLQQENEAKLKQAQEEQIRDQQEASARYDEEERKNLEEARQLEEARAAARSANLGKDALKLLASVAYISAISFGSLFLYFLPAFVARQKKKFRTVFAINLLTGWTVVGWIVALVMACAGEPEKAAEVANF